MHVMALTFLFILTVVGTVALFLFWLVVTILRAAVCKPADCWPRHAGRRLRVRRNCQQQHADRDPCDSATAEVAGDSIRWKLVSAVAAGRSLRDARRHVNVRSGRDVLADLRHPHAHKSVSSSSARSVGAGIAGGGGVYLCWLLRSLQSQTMNLWHGLPDQKGHVSLGSDGAKGRNK